MFIKSAHVFSNTFNLENKKTTLVAVLSHQTTQEKPYQLSVKRECDEFFNDGGLII